MRIVNGNVAISRKGITGQFLYGKKFENDRHGALMIYMLFSY